MTVDATYSGSNYKKQGGATWEVGGTLNILSGGTHAIESGGKRTINSVQQPISISFAAAAGGSNVCEVTITVKDGGGTAIAKPWILTLWLSDAATGAGLTATTASGAVAAKTSSGADFATLTSKKALLVQTLATGVYILSITDTAKTGFYVCAQVGDLTPQVSDVLVTGNYG